MAWSEFPRRRYDIRSVYKNNETKAEQQVTKVGTVEYTAEEVKKFLIELFDSGLRPENVRFPEDVTIDMDLDFSPCLRSDFTVRQKYGNGVSGSISIHAQSGDVEAIFQVLLQMEIASFNLKAVDKKYLAAVKDFLSNNPFLRRLSIGKGFLEEGQDLVPTIAKSSKSLHTVVLGENGIEYLRRIHESQSLNTLTLSRVSITPDIIDGLVECFAQSSKIKTLDMSSYGAVHADVSKLAIALKNNHTLEEWNLSGKTLKDSEFILECARLLKVNKCLKKLDLRAYSPSDRCSIDPDTWVSVGMALSQNSSLEYLDMAGHQVSEESWKALGEGLKANCGLLTFKASRPYYYEGKDTDILLPIFEALRDNQTLQSLELSNFDLSDSFASLKALESILIESKSLKSLVMIKSSMTDEGVAILSRSLPQMKGIERLDLSFHSCTLKGAQTFAEGMKNNHSIVSVNFGGRYHGGSTVPAGSVARSVTGTVFPRLGAAGFEKEFHEIEYYARMNRKGRRCIGSKTPVDPSLWALVLTKALKKEKSLWWFEREDVRYEDWFAGDHDTSIDAVFYLLRDVFRLPMIETE